VDIVICPGEVNGMAMTSAVEKGKSGLKGGDKDENTGDNRELKQCVQYLLEQASDFKGPFMTSLAGPKSLWRRCMEPWRGCFPRQPLFAAISLQVIGWEMPPPPAAQGRVSTGATSDLLFHIQQPIAPQVEDSSCLPFPASAVAPLGAPGTFVLDSKGAPSAPYFSSRSITNMRSVTTAVYAFITIPHLFMDL
jgi:hypothetical protein